jgi:hypothetical protein
MKQLNRMQTNQLLLPFWELEGSRNNSGKCYKYSDLHESHSFE